MSGGAVASAPEGHAWWGSCECELLFDKAEVAVKASLARVGCRMHALPSEGWLARVAATTEVVKRSVCQEAAA